VLVFFAFLWCCCGTCRLARSLPLAFSFFIINSSGRGYGEQSAVVGGRSRFDHYQQWSGIGERSQQLVGD
jgi:hypothetical protein